MEDELREFFATMTPLLTGERDVASMTARLGPSPSGEARVHLYQRLVAGDHARILDDLFPTVRHAIVELPSAPSSWGELVEDYRRAHPARDWEVARYGQHFADFLGELHQRDTRWPAYLEELADFHFTRYCAAVAGGEPPELDVSVFVRQYAHQCPQFVLAVEDGREHPPAPEARPTIAIVYQALDTLRPRIFYPSMPALLALSRWFGRLGEALPPGVTVEAVDAGEARLIEAALLPGPRR